MECLLHLLREQNPEPFLTAAGCEAALVLAEEERILPWAAALLRKTPHDASPAIARRLDLIERDAAIAGFYWSSELKNILRAFNQSNIVAVPLKGPLLAEALYGNAALRLNRDLDLLVSVSDLPRAESILSAIGFLPGTADDYHRPWRRESTLIELHHNVENPLAFNFHIATALHRARPATFQGISCRHLAPEDELLFLCLHAARHRYDRLSLVLDLQLAFEKLPASTEAWRPRPEVASLNPLLILGLAMVRHLHPGLTLPIEFPAPERQRLHLQELADRLWHRLLAQPSPCLDWHAAHTFFVEIELPGWPRHRRRLRHLRILLGRVIEPDIAFAAQLGLHRHWQARMMRPLRLLAERTRR